MDCNPQSICDIDLGVQESSSESTLCNTLSVWNLKYRPSLHTIRTWLINATNVYSDTSNTAPIYS